MDYGKRRRFHKFLTPGGWMRVYCQSISTLSLTHTHTLRYNIVNSNESPVQENKVNISQLTFTQAAVKQEPGPISVHHSTSPTVCVTWILDLYLVASVRDSHSFNEYKRFWKMCFLTDIMSYKLRKTSLGNQTLRQWPITYKQAFDGRWLLSETFFNDINHVSKFHGSVLKIEWKQVKMCGFSDMFAVRL